MKVSNRIDLMIRNMNIANKSDFVLFLSEDAFKELKSECNFAKNSKEIKLSEFPKYRGITIKPSTSHHEILKHKDN